MKEAMQNEAGTRSERNKPEVDDVATRTPQQHSSAQPTHRPTR
jgi:hypothetical protein